MDAQRIAAISGLQVKLLVPGKGDSRIVNDVVYNSETAKELRNTFLHDLSNAIQIEKEKWLARPWHKQLPEKLSGYFPLLCKGN
jgi:hypothetical protein